MAYTQFCIPRLNQPLKLWEKVEIIVGDGESAGHYVARIEDFIDEGIIISSPEYTDGNTLLRDGCRILFLLTREDAVYQFVSTITRITRDGQTVHLLVRPKGPQRVQRRQFVRVDLFTGVSWVNLADNPLAGAGDSEMKWKKSKTVNISGGGVLMAVKESPSTGDLMLLKVDLFTEIGLPDVVASICRRTFRDDGKYLVGVQFLRSTQLAGHFTQGRLAALPATVRDFDQSAQNRLVTYVFQQQIELRKKGLL
ncbi:MAG: PilZ domain-containing protein [bacterium]